MCDDSESDAQYVRDQALALGEEKTFFQPNRLSTGQLRRSARDKKSPYLVYKENLESM
jgi:phosphoenolpyruvate carboxykinase (GTP)